MTEKRNVAADEEGRHPVEVLVDDFLQRQRQGEKPTIEEYVAAHPDIASEIRELFPTILQMEQLKVEKVQSSSSPQVLVGPANLERLGDFLILGEIGRGGMGIVYEAEQRSLGRHVAVKVLPKQSMLDGRRLQRFQREAQTAARLHHTNIVPIFGVGEHEGLHYYVMQCIRGVGLDEIVREFRRQGRQPGARNLLEVTRSLLKGRPREKPQARSVALTASTGGSSSAINSGFIHVSSHHRVWQAIAALGMQVAEALQYAHGQGTLHRDVKPANLLLDGDGVVWVTDFGLAKAIDEDNLTHSGDMVGTLQYMAPEQFRGIYDARSDIYCLGLTLYELLTLQPAFADSTRSGLLHKVSQSEPTRPGRLIDGIPRDLETIVQKCIAREPEDRYRSAGDLAEDLHSFLLDRPIQARRLGTLEQFTRWCRRNKALATAMAVAFLAILSTAVVGWIGYVKQSQRSKEAVAATQRAEANLRLSMQFLGNLFHEIRADLEPPVGLPQSESGETVEVSENAEAFSESLADDLTEPSDLLRGRSRVQPVISALNARLLKTLLAFYDLFAAENQNNKDLQQDAAEAYARVGDIQQRLDKMPQAHQSYHRALELFEQLGKGTKEQDRFASQILAIHNRMGYGWAAAGDAEKAAAAWGEVIRRVESDVELQASNFARHELARAYTGLGVACMKTLPASPRRDDPVLAELVSLRGKALRLTHDLLQEEPTQASYLLGRARACRVFRRHWGGREVGTQLYEEALDRLETLVAQNPAPEHRYELAETLLVRSGRGEGDAEQAVQLARRLVEQHPTIPEYRACLVRSLSAQLRNYQRDRVVAASIFEEIIKHQQQIVADSVQLAERYRLCDLLARSLVWLYENEVVEKQRATVELLLRHLTQIEQRVFKGKSTWPEGRFPWRMTTLWLRRKGFTAESERLVEIHDLARLQRQNK